jgi:hypothetical protein
MSQNPVPNPPNPVPQPAGTGDPYAQNANMAIELAMRNAGLLDKLDFPDSEDYRQYMPRLNGFMNFHQTQGLKLWLQEDITFTPVLGQQQYVWGPGGDINMPRPTRIIAGYFTYPVGSSSGGGQLIQTDSGISIQTDSGQLISTSGGTISGSGQSIKVRYPLSQLSRDEFNNLGVLNVQGITNSFFVDKQQLAVNVWLWLNPDLFTSQSTVTLTTQVQVNQVISITDQMNFPIEWFQFMHWGFACEIDQGQPLAVQAKNEKMRDMYQEKLEDFDVEDTSTYIVPDTRLGFGSGRFA